MSDWIDHDGKGMPVSGGTMVLVKLRDGLDEDAAGYRASPADFWNSTELWCNWSHNGINSDEDIVAYKIIKAFNQFETVNSSTRPKPNKGEIE